MNSHCLKCGTPDSDWTTEAHSPCCSDECLSLAYEEGLYEPTAGARSAGVADDGRSG